MPLVQERNFAVSISVANQPVPGLFDSFDGGEVTSDGASSYNAGGMVDAEAIPGTPRTAEIKIARGYRGERDASIKRWLNTMINQAVVIGKQPLNPDKTPVVGGLEVFRGILTGVTTPKHDSNGSAVTMLELTVMPTGLPS